MAFGKHDEVVIGVKPGGHFVQRRLHHFGAKISDAVLEILDETETSAQSYKHSMLVNYDSRVVIISKLLILMTLES